MSDPLSYIDDPPMRSSMTMEEMGACLVVWDQTIGCLNCGRAWWGDNSPDDLTLFHADGCPLKGRKDIDMLPEESS